MNEDAKFLDGIVRLWASHYYPDLEETWAEQRAYYYREFVKSVCRRLYPARRKAAEDSDLAGAAA